MVVVDDCYLVFLMLYVGGLMVKEINLSKL